MGRTIGAVTCYYRGDKLKLKDGRIVIVMDKSASQQKVKVMDEKTGKTEVIDDRLVRGYHIPGVTDTDGIF